MSDKSKIEWTDAEWTIVQGCNPVSPGCRDCYVPKVLHRLAHNPNPKVSPPLQGLVERHKDKLRFTGKVACREDRLTWPLSWRNPRKVFVPSHGDIFHKDVPDEFIDKIFAVIALCPQHQFQVLTKRPERMRDYFEDGPDARIAQLIPGLCNQVGVDVPPILEGDGDIGCIVGLLNWPLPNVWLGVSCERQEEADERIPLLLATPAAKRFISAEPLLARIDLTEVRLDGPVTLNVLRPADTHRGPLAALDWVIVGGESGTTARPMHPDWARSLRDQCAAAGVPFFFKQWGAWAPQYYAHREGETVKALLKVSLAANEMIVGKPNSELPPVNMKQMAKKAAGRLLDGVEHSEWPA